MEALLPECTMHPRLVLATTALAVIGCAGGNQTGPSSQTVALIVVTPAGDTLIAVGQTRQLTAVVKNAAGNAIPGKTVTWQSSAPSVVSIDAATGLATALGNGQATLSATVDGKTGQAVVLVDQQVGTVEISPTSASASSLGATQQFTASAKDGNGALISGVKFLWVSSDPSVATVDSTGKVTVRGPGVATITVAARGVPAHAVLTVTQMATQLTITAQPGNASEGHFLPSAIQVEIRDAGGALVANARNAVTLAIGNDPVGGAVLGGTRSVNAIGGIATFSGVQVDRAGQGFTLVASAAGLTPATSAAFNVFLHFISVSAGNAATCGVTASGALYCWGYNGAGLLGDGTFTDRAVPTHVTFGTLTTRLTPVPAVSPAGVYFTVVTIAAANGCAATALGAGYCWGSNTSGQVGDGTVIEATVPTAIAQPVGVSFSSVVAGGPSACALSFAAAVYCWGNNTIGQLGDGSFTNRPTPVPVSSPPGISFVQLTYGTSYGCAVSSIGTVYCWGFNGLGGLGDGTNVNRTTLVGKLRRMRLRMVLKLFFLFFQLTYNIFNFANNCFNLLFFI